MKGKTTLPAVVKDWSRYGKIRFSDGETFDLSGDFRVETRFDGAYVVGRGQLIPVRTETDGAALIEKLKISEP